ncbi:MAG TPA: PEP-CTERM sorting domain-containing protein [Bryobacteraceae bacterium]|jgi:hypothetical protein|nr:PEP-CTERM sorting domain-containing protein [Bryobacteraceae bacterium]
MSRVPVDLLVCFFSVVAAGHAGHIQLDIHAEVPSVIAVGHVNATSIAHPDSFDTLLFSGPERELAASQESPAPGSSYGEGPGVDHDNSAVAADLDESLGFFQSSRMWESALLVGDFYVAKTQSGVPGQPTRFSNSLVGINPVFDPDTAGGGNRTSPEDSSSNSPTSGREGDSEGLTTAGSTMPLTSAMPDPTTIANNPPLFLSSAKVEEAAGAEDKNSELEIYRSLPDPNSTTSSSSALHVPEPSTLLSVMIGLASIPVGVWSRGTHKKKRLNRKI